MTTSHRQNATDRLREKAGDVRDDLQEIGSLARDAAHEKVAELRDNAAERVGDLRNVADEYYNLGKERAAEIEKSLEQRIQKNPLQSVLIAGGLGMLLGILWIRR